MGGGRIRSWAPRQNCVTSHAELPPLLLFSFALAFCSNWASWLPRISMIRAHLNLLFFWTVVNWLNKETTRLRKLIALAAYISKLKPKCNASRSRNWKLRTTNHKQTTGISQIMQHLSYGQSNNFLALCLYLFYRSLSPSSCWWNTPNPFWLPNSNRVLLK